MNGSAKFKSVPIIDVTKENVAVVKPLIRGGIIGADFIAIDCVSISGLKVALSQKILENFYFSKINIPNHYPEQKF